MECLTSYIGETDYLPAWDLQRRLHSKVASGEVPCAMLLVQHPHIYTIGRRGAQSDILASSEDLDQLGITVHEIDRGGEVTYHGPGQLISYPIVNLRAANLGPLRYVAALEETTVRTLREYGIQADSDNRPTGVWVDEAKIAAIGVRVSRGVTTHGLALNVNPNLRYFDHIVPCGMPNVKMTSMADQGVEISVPEVVPDVIRAFGEVFSWEMRPDTSGQFCLEV